MHGQAFCLLYTSNLCNLFSLYECSPFILYNMCIMKNQVEGDISLKKASFSYPNRDNIQVLQNMDLEVPHSQMIALVGSSGCGKSTIIQLVERFYDPTEGQVVCNQVLMGSYLTFDLSFKKGQIIVA